MIIIGTKEEIEAMINEACPYNGRESCDDDCRACWNRSASIVIADPKKVGTVKKDIDASSFLDFLSTSSKEWDASCENCEHAFRGADPLKIIQDSKYLFYCAAGHAYGGSETVCSEWRRKEGDRNEDVQS